MSAPMEPKVSARTDVSFTQTAPRPTPTPARVKFSEVLAAAGGAVVGGARAAISVVPGGNIALGAMSGAGGALHIGGGVGVGAGIGGLGSGGVSFASTAEGPGGAAGGETAGMAGALQQSQDQNLYYLQLQQQMNAQDRAFETLSNILKSEHDTAKNAIGNIR